MKFIVAFIIAISLFGSEAYEYTLPPFEITSIKPFERSTLFKNNLKLTDNNEHAERVVQIQETAVGFRQPILRGLQGDQIHLTVDGFDFTNSMFRSGPNQYYSFIPNEFVQQISLNKDVNDLGNNSFGGTINRDLGFLSSNENVIRVQNYISGGKAFSSYQYEDFKVGALYKKINYIETPDGKQEHTNYNQKGFYIEKDKYKLVYTRSDEVDRTDKFLKGKPRIYDKQYYLGVFKDFNVNYDYTLKVSYQNFYENINNPKNDIERMDKTNTNVYQLQNEYYLTDDLIFTSKHKYEGITYEKFGEDKKDYDVYDNSIALNYFKNYYDFKYSFSVMGDYATIADKDFWNIGAGVKAEYKKIYVSISQGYKYPTIYNLNEAISDSLYEIPNSDLKKETSIKTEIGYTNHVDYFKYKGTVFYNKLYDMITRQQTNKLAPDGSNMFKVTNANNGDIYGANTNLIFENSGLLIDFFAEYTYGKTDIDYISKLTPFRTDTRIEYKNIGVTHKYAIKSNTLSDADKSDIRIKGHNDGYNQFDVDYLYAFKNNDTLKFSVKNIFNNEGRVLGSSNDFEKRYLYLELTIKI
jgi:hemoglobin/transferrin/lactoferrin receptor protein